MKLESRKLYFPSEPDLEKLENEVNAALSSYVVSDFKYEWVNKHIRFISGSYEEGLVIMQHELAEFPADFSHENVMELARKIVETRVKERERILEALE